MLMCPVLGIDAPGSRRRILFTHQLVLNTFGSEHMDGHVYACSFQQLGFQCGQHVPQHC